MADADPQQTLMVDNNITLSEDMQEVTDVSDCLQEDDPKGVIAADILQQAFKEAEELSHTGILYTGEGNTVVSEDRIQFPTDHSYITSVSCANFPESHSISANYETVDATGDVDANSAVSCTDFQNLSVSAAGIVPTQHVNSTTEEIAVLPESDETELRLNSDALLSTETVENSRPCITPAIVYTHVTSMESTNSLQSHHSDNSSMSVQSCTTTSFTNNSPTVPPPLTSTVARVSLPPKTTTAPLGSSENPIQIIQQGNTYHSTQVLTKQQLQQIAHVLQQQQVNKVIQNGGKAVLYDEATNTRIIYRVIYPSELQEKTVSDGRTSVKKGMGRGRSRSRRGWTKRNTDDVNRGEVTLSKQEKEEKKKHRPRTRSGRISKPPSYMVKDYKRIHHLDFYEEPHDDSDGGYSDYQISDEERVPDSSTTASAPGVSTTKQRNFNCETCDKAYIGRGGLARHYRLNPTHGNLPEGEGVSTQDENSNSSLASSVLSNSGYPSQTTNASVSSPRVNKEPETSPPPITASAKKKAQLKELLSVYRDDELIETVMPRLAKALTLWKFLLLKHETEKQHNIPDMFKDFEILLQRMKKVAQNCLSPASSLETSHKDIIEIQSEELAKMFCLDVGTYKVENTECISGFEDINPVEDSQFDNSTSEVLSSPPLKRKRIIPGEASAMQEALSATSLPDQLLSDVVPEVSTMELSAMHSENLESEIQNPDSSQLLSATLSTTDFHNALSSRVLFDFAGSTVPSSHLQTAIDSLTTVTSSSLSSGSLSTVVTPESLKTHGLIALKKSPQFDSASHSDVENIHLAALQNSTSNGDSVDISTNTSNMGNSHGNEQEHTIFCSTDAPSISAEMSSTMNNTIHLFETGSSLESGTVILGLKQLSSVPSISVPNTGISLLKSNLNFNKPLDSTSGSTNAHSDFSMSQNVTNCLTLDHSVQNEIHSQSAVSECTKSICTSVVIDSGAEHTESNEHFSDLHEVPPVDEPPEASLQPSGMGSPSIIRQLVLPDGQVIGIWSAGESQEDKDISGHLVQGFLPGNLIIVQNSDGSLQLPNEQDISSENLQALLMNQEDTRKDNS